MLKRVRRLALCACGAVATRAEGPVPGEWVEELLAEGREKYVLSRGSTDMLYWSGWIAVLEQIRKRAKAERLAAKKAG
jgi:hypothetical protein